MRRSRILLSLALIAVPGSAWAQSGSLFGSNGVNARSGTSSSGLNSNRANPANTGGTTGGTITGFTGQSASSSQGFFDGAMGSNGFVGSTNTGFTGNRNASNATMGAGQTGTSGGALGGNRGGARGGAAGQTGFGRQQSFARNNNSFGRNGRNQTQGGIGQGMSGLGAAARTVQPQQRIAFPYTPSPVTQVHTAVSATFTNVPEGRFDSLSVQVSDQGVLTLRGHVANDDDRKLAEALARLEPGVRAVANELIISAE